MSEKSDHPSGDAKLVKPHQGNNPTQGVVGEEAKPLPSIKTSQQLRTEDEGGISPLKAMAKEWGMEFIEHLRPADIDDSVRGIIPEDIARKYGVIAIRQSDDGTLTVAPCDPLNISITDSILPARLNVSKIVAVVCPGADILACIDAIYSTDDSLIEIEKANQSAPMVEARASEIVLQDGETSEAPGVNSIVHALLRRALQKGASDISIEPGEREIVVRLKIDGRLKKLEPPPDLGWHKKIVSMIKSAGGMDITENRRPLDGHITVLYREQRYDIRIATMPVEWGESVTLRILDPKNAERSLEQIGFSDADIQTLEKQINLPNGVILVTGPTGSGKTTTLYSCLGRRNDEETKIITIEDPVEYHIRGFNQSSINERAGLGFAESLRASLRQIPDIVLIGEMRDTETASIAMRAALTGHLVFSTLHTNDAASTITRLVDMGIERFIIAEAVRTIISQRLARKLCPECSRPSNDLSLAGILGLPDDADTSSLKSAFGCQMCNGGYRGRVAINEILIVGDKIKNAILKGESATVLEQLARESGMLTIREDGNRKALQGITTLEEIRRLTAFNS